MSTNLPNLDEIFGGYFHQDWQDDAPTAMGIVDRYLSEWPQAEVASAADELQALLASATEEELAGWLKALGSYYAPTADGLTCRNWLDQVLKKLRDA